MIPPPDTARPRRPRTTFSKTLYWRISATFVLALAIGTAAQATIFQILARRYNDISEQQLNWDIGEQIAAQIEPLLGPPLEIERIQQKFYEIEQLNPKIEIYLLSSDGRVLVSLAENYEVKAVPVEPIKSFLDPGNSPHRALYGISPKGDGKHPAVFSAARLQTSGEDAFIYAVIGGDRYEVMSSMIAEYSVIRLSQYGLLTTLLISGVLGLTAFFFITRRFARLTAVIQDFEAGNLNIRAAVGTEDEIGIHAQVFNRMADTISANIEKLKCTDRLRRDLMANISHDLRRPVTLMQASLETISIRDSLLTPDERNKLIDNTARGCQRLDAMLNALFELSKLNAKEQEPQFSSVNLSETISELAERFQPIAAQQGIELSTELGSNLPHVRADSQMIERVLSNLIDNAIKYTNRGGKVIISLSRLTSKLRVVVSDTGIGIPADELEFLFARFYRSTTGQSKDSTGTGLGLAISHKMIELHGEELKVESVENQGTRFIFDLPIIE